MTTTATRGEPVDPETLAALRDQVGAARTAAPALAIAGTAQKNAVLARVADLLRERSAAIVQANGKDMVTARDAGRPESFLDRLELTPQRVAALADSLSDVIALPDPIGEVIDESLRPSGLRVGRVRVPLGLISSIYESRPNVTIDIAALCLKSGNACVLRGGREAVHSNTLLATTVTDALTENGLPGEAVQLIRNPDRALVAELLRLNDLIDLIVPRGGKPLIERVRDEASMPVVAGGIGICHTYVDSAADTAMAIEIVDNAKTRRISICNALDVVLLHRDAAAAFLPALVKRWGGSVEIRADEASLGILQKAGANAIAVGPDDYDTEFLAMRCALHVVDDLDAAIQHIADHWSGHSEAIVTNDYHNAERFLNEVDAAAVFVNTSTQFNDGGQFGLGAEVGISTGKMHARGPMGLRELTSYKWVVRGDGQIRPD